MRSAGRIALRVAAAFATIATLWAITITLLPSQNLRVLPAYDSALDFAFIIVTGAVTYAMVSRELRARASAEQAAIAEAWRAANDALEERVIERTEALQKANGLLQAEMAERMRAEQDLTNLLELSRYIASTHNLRQLLGLLLDAVQRLIGYTSATIFQCDGDRLVPLDYRGVLPKEQVLRGAVPTGKSPGEVEVLQQRRPLIIGDVLGDSEEARAYRQAIGQRLAGSDPCSRSWMGVPLVIEDRVVGMLRLDHELPGYFTARHAELAKTIANLAAVAIQNAMSYEDAQRAAVLKERSRLARDLHDSIIQAVYAIIWNLRTAHEMLPADTNRTGRLLELALNTAKTCLLDLRSLVFELRPELIEQYGLAELLARHIESVQGGAPVDFSMEISGEPELSLRAKEALFRIAQEALQNAIKHSQGQQVRLQLRQDLAEVFMEIADDGVGFDPGIPSPAQLGLASMRERAAKIGGKLDILSGYGRGTHVQIKIPLQAAQAAA